MQCAVLAKAHFFFVCVSCEASSRQYFFLLSVCSLSVQKMSEGFIGLENSPLCVLMLRIKSMLAKSHIEIAAVLHSSVYRRIDQNIFLQKFRESLCGCWRARLGFS